MGSVRKLSALSRARVRPLVALAASVCLISGGIVGLAASPAAAAGNTIVSSGAFFPANPIGAWRLANNTGTEAFVSGPSTPPGGVGSLALSVVPATHESVFNYGYGACATTNACTDLSSTWTKLTDVNALSFSTYRTSGDQAGMATYNIEVDPHPGVGAQHFTTLVFIPNYPSVVNSTWQTWNAMSPADGTWYSSTNLSGDFPGSPFACVFQAAGCNASWSQINAAYPNARILGGLGPNVGSGGNFAGNVDNVTIGTSTPVATTTFDFEPVCTTVCYVSTTGSDSSTGISPSQAFLTVQHAANTVTAGGTVNVAAGTYNEQVVVPKAETITGAGQATTTIQGPATLANSACIPLTSGQPTRAIVTVCGSASSTVTMSGFTISGGAAGADASANCSPLITGAWVSDNETLDISQSTVTNIYNAAGPATWGCQQGVGIRAGSTALGLVGHLTADHLTVLRYQKNGIVVDGVGSSTTITNGLVQGNQLAGLSPNIAMNGIQIARGASGSISGTTVSGNQCDHPSCGTDPLTKTQSAGILLFNNPTTVPVPVVSVTNNIVTGNDIGIYAGMLTGTATISGNTVNANRDEGIFLDEGTALVTNNQITSNGSVPFGAGVYATQGGSSLGDTTATLTGNTISGNPTGVAITDTAADAFSTNIAIHRNALTSNATFGVSNLALPVTDAACNWWGTGTGPGPVGPGFGDKVTTGVSFANWLGTSNLNGACGGPPGPDAPTITSVSAGPTPDPSPVSVMMSITPGTGSAPTTYVVTCVSLSTPPSATVVASGPAGSPLLVGGLTSPGGYQCTAIAINAIGTSGPSAPFTFFLGGTGSCHALPTAPTALTTAPGNASATVSWAPSHTCVAGYIVTPFVNGVAVPELALLIPASELQGTTTTVIKGLTNGVAYKFTVAAENGFATGPASVFTSTITVGAPAAASVTHVARVAKGAVKVTFKAGATNGAPITSFTATCKSSNGGVTKTKKGKTSPIVVNGLTAKRTYRCSVTATNSRGTGPASRASSPVKP